MFRFSYLCILSFFFLSCSENEIQKKNDNNEIKSEIQIISEKIENDPNNLELRLERVNYYKNRKQYDAALFNIKECLRIDSSNATVNYIASELYFQISKSNHNKVNFPNLALFYSDKAINLNNQFTSAYLIKGEILLALGEYMESISILNSALEIDFNLEKAHLLMGYCFKKLNDEKNAINCFNNSIIVNPEFLRGYEELGVLYHHKKDTLAITYYNNALKIDSLRINILYNKALFYHNVSKNYNLALEAYAKLHEVDPFHANAHYNLGHIHMELDLFDVAVNNFSDAIYSNSEFYQSYYSRGVCFEAIGNILQAETDYSRAIEINPNYSFAIDALKKLKEQNNKFKK